MVLRGNVGLAGSLPSHWESDLPQGWGAPRGRADLGRYRRLIYPSSVALVFHDQRLASGLAPPVLSSSSMTTLGTVVIAKVRFGFRNAASVFVCNGRLLQHLA